MVSADSVEGIAPVPHAAQDTTATLTEADEAVNELAGLATELNEVVGRFKV